MSTLEAALELAAAGWPVFPLKGKLPAIAGGHGFHDATTDSDQITAWWQRWPTANIGIAVPVNVVVLDVDPRHGGEETFAELQATHGSEPPTLTTITGSGGRHLWFVNRGYLLEQRPLGDGLDVRVGGKGYVLAPPSVHPDTGGIYRWENPLLELAPLPIWIAERLRPPLVVSGPRPALQVVSGKVDVLAWAQERVSRAPEGRRHDILLRTARLLGGYVAGGTISESAAREALLEAASAWPNLRKSEATIRDGLAHGQLRPLEAS